MPVNEQSGAVDLARHRQLDIVVAREDRLCWRWWGLRRGLLLADRRKLSPGFIRKGPGRLATEASQQVFGQLLGLARGELGRGRGEPAIVGIEDCRAIAQRPHAGMIRY